MIAGAAIFTGGFFVGKNTVKPAEVKPPDQPPKPEKIEIPEEIAKQVANWMNYDGRPKV